VGTPLELYDAPANRFVAQFIGMPQMNLLPAKLMPDSPKGASEVGIRPEHLTLCPINDSPLKGNVELVESLGNETLIHINLGLATESAVIVRQYTRTDLKIGDVAAFTWDANHMHYFDDQGEILKHTAQGEAA
jgi:multiple sugar transport system ATP-binding protein